MHRPLIRRIANRYRCRSLTIEDLVQEGVLGAITAVQRFDLTRGLRLSTYAAWWVRQHISRAVEQQDHLIHVPGRALRESSGNGVSREVSPPLFSAPSTSLKVESEVPELHAYLVALSNPVPLVGANSEAVHELEDTNAPDPAEELLRNWERDTIRRLLPLLNSRQRRVIEARFGLAHDTRLTLQALGQELGISPERVRQLEAQSLARLHDLLSE